MGAVVRNGYLSDYYKVSGIYKILNKINGKFYIGRATCIYNRVNTHVSMLRGNRHPNIHLQRAWNKYGKDVFVFSVVQIGLKSDLIELEQYYLDTLKPKYNISDSATSNSADRWTPEFRKAISDSKIGKKLNITEEDRINRRNRALKNLSKDRRVKISQYTKDGKYIRDWDSMKEAAEYYSINSCVISSCVRRVHNYAAGFRWSYKGEVLQELLPSKRVYPKKVIKNRKPVIQYSLSGEYINEFDSLTSAQEQTGVAMASIIRQIQGKVKRAGKFKWEFKNKEDGKSN